MSMDPLQQFWFLRKQTFRVTAPSATVGCAPSNQPGTSVPQTRGGGGGGGHEVGIRVPAAP